MGNFLSLFPYHNCADSIMYFHADIDILKNRVFGKFQFVKQKNPKLLSC